MIFPEIWQIIRIKTDLNRSVRSTTCNHNINFYLPSILYAHIHTRSKLGQTTTSTSILFLANTTSTYTYDLFIHVHQVEPDKSHHHPLYSLQTQYQYLLTVYFICTHIHKASWVKQPYCHPSFSLQTQHRLILTVYLCTYTKLSQTSHIYIHWILCKHNINFYLQTI